MATAQSNLDDAKHHLATVMLNQVGVEWDEACDSVDLFVQRQGIMSAEELTGRLCREAFRYEDM